MSGLLVLTVLVGLTPAWGQDPTRRNAETSGSRWSGSATFATSFVSGPVNPRVTTSTLTGQTTWGPTWNPALDLGLGLSAAYRARPEGVLSLSWAVRRGIRFDDTGDDAPPGVGDAARQAPPEFGDLVLSYLDASVVGSADGRVGLLVGGRLTLPASRESWVCNPLVAAVGASVGARVRLGPVAQLRATGSADVAGHLHAAPVRGACATPGAPSVETLTGAVAPGPDGGWAAPNPLATFGAGVTLFGWHALFGLIPGVADRRSYQRVLTDLTLGVRAQVQRADPAASATTLTGPVPVDAAHSPPIVQVPFSLGVGGLVHDHLAVRAGVSNAVPALLYDPSARLRALPSTLAVSLSLTGSW